jgi:hypothetical protein
MVLLWKLISMAILHINTLLIEGAKQIIIRL